MTNPKILRLRKALAKHGRSLSMTDETAVFYYDGYEVSQTNNEIRPEDGDQTFSPADLVPIDENGDPTDNLSLASALLGATAAKGTYDLLLSIAKSYIGYHEGSNNDTLFGDWIGAPHQAWCASMQSWLNWKAGVDNHKSASAQALVDSYPTGHTPRVGALVGFHMPGGHAGINHVGRVIGILKDGRIRTIEGNTSDQVAYRTRATDIVVYYGYVKYASSVKPVPTPTPVSNVPASLDPKSPLYHTRAKVVHNPTQLWNATIGTKRTPNPGKGGIVHVFAGQPYVKHGGNTYVHISWAGHDGWVRYDYVRWC